MSASELIRKAAHRYGLSPADVAAQVVRDEPHLTLEEARWLVDGLYRGVAMPMVVAAAVISCIVEKAPPLGERKTEGQQ